MARYAVSQHDCILPVCNLRSRIFYPCSASNSASSAGAPWHPYSSTFIPNESAYGLADFIKLPFPYILSFILSPLLNVQLSNFHNAPMHPGDNESKSFPLMIFSHGLGGSLGAYATFCSEIAASGRIVIAIEHGDGTASVAYPVRDGKRVHVQYARRGDKKYIGKYASDFAMRHGQLLQRIDEVKEVLEAAQLLNNGHGISRSLYNEEHIVNFTGRIDCCSEKLVLAGHSFGGGTVVAAALKGLICAKMIIALDAWMYPLGKKLVAEEQLKGDTNVLFIDQERSNMKDSIELRQSLNVVDRALVDAVCIRGGSHNNSSDYATKLPRFIAEISGLTPKNSDPEELMRVQNETCLKFVMDLSDGNYRSWADFIERVNQGLQVGLKSAPVRDQRKSSVGSAQSSL